MTDLILVPVLLSFVRLDEAYQRKLIDRAVKMDRLHGSRMLRTIQDVDIPEVTLPVGPGRNLSVLVEAAVRNHILISKGYDASEAFIERQKKFRVPAGPDFRADYPG